MSSWGRSGTTWGGQANRSYHNIPDHSAGYSNGYGPSGDPSAGYLRRRHNSTGNLKMTRQEKQRKHSERKSKQQIPLNNVYNLGPEPQPYVRPTREQKHDQNRARNDMRQPGSYNKSDHRNDPIYGSSAQRNEPIYGTAAERKQPVYGADNARNEPVYGTAAHRNDPIYGTAAPRNEPVYKASKNEPIYGKVDPRNTTVPSNQANRKPTYGRTGASNGVTYNRTNPVRNSADDPEDNPSPIRARTKNPYGEPQAKAKTPQTHSTEPVALAQPNGDLEQPVYQRVRPKSVSQLRPTSAHIAYSRPTIKVNRSTNQNGGPQYATDPSEQNGKVQIMRF